MMLKLLLDAHLPITTAKKFVNAHAEAPLISRVIRLPTDLNSTAIGT